MSVNKRRHHFWDAAREKDQWGAHYSKAISFLLCVQCLFLQFVSSNIIIFRYPVASSHVSGLRHRFTTQVVRGVLPGQSEIKRLTLLILQAPSAFHGHCATSLRERKTPFISAKDAARCSRITLFADLWTPTPLLKKVDFCFSVFRCLFHNLFNHFPVFSRSWDYRTAS